MAFSDEEIALLQAIARSESAGSWNVIYGGSHFNDYDKHPAKFVTITSGPHKGEKSSAAGKFQITKTTYDRVAPKLGISDFSPESQMRIALYLAKEAYGPDLLKDLRDGKAADVGKKLSEVWTSLPGGIEATVTPERFASRYDAALASPEPPLPVPSGPARTSLIGMPNAAMYGQDRLGPNTQPPEGYDPFGSPETMGAFDPRLASMVVPTRNVPGGSSAAGGALSKEALASIPLPAPAPLAPQATPQVTTVSAAAAPVPFPRAQPPAQQATETQYARLPSGKMVQVGTFPGSNPGTAITITRGPNGEAVISRSSPGFMNLARMGEGTIANGIVQDKINEAAPQVMADVGTRAQGIVNSLGGTASAIGNTLGAFVGDLGGMFGGGKPKSPVMRSLGVSGSAIQPASPFTGGTALAGTSTGNGNAYLGASKPEAGKALGATTTYTTREMQVENPDYLAYIASQKADPVGTGPGAFADLKALGGPVAPTPAPAPPRYITVTKQVPSSVITGPTYTVGRGDTLSDIAARSGVSVSTLASLNKIADPNRIMEGQTLQLGGSTPAPASKPATKPSSVSSPAPSQPAAKTFSGSSSGRTYVVGQKYSNANGTYVAQSDGSFKKVA